MKGDCEYPVFEYRRYGRRWRKCYRDGVHNCAGLKLCTQHLGIYKKRIKWKRIITASQLFRFAIGPTPFDLKAIKAAGKELEST